MPQINASRISFARMRRRMTKAQLARALDLTSRSIQNYESGDTAPEGLVLTRLASVLGFPEDFFLVDENMPEMPVQAASFRAQSRMTDASRHCALSAGAIAFTISDWMEARFKLPATDLPDLGDLPPEEAAAVLRRMWGLGNAPVPNMIRLLESKGVRVFSLTEETRHFDAFCTWHKDEVPFVFLNTATSAERSRFDAAHELGHLVMDVYGLSHGVEGAGEGESHNHVEARANAFAAAFLMPKESVIAKRPPAFTIDHLMRLKHHWKVSLVAVARRYRSLNLITEWGYRNLCMEISRRGFRTSEPQPLARETSLLLEKVFAHLKASGVTRVDIARQLHISVDEINALTFGLTTLSVVPGTGTGGEKATRVPRLSLVRSTEPPRAGTPPRRPELTSVGR